MTAILGPDGRPLPASKPKRVRASYDAAATTRLNQRHWGNADGKSADAALDPAVRQKIRERARYEAQESNSYAKGMVLTLANDTIGTGPRLQLTIPGRQDAAKRIEREFMLWTYEVRLAEKLRTMRMAKAVDGEVFAAFTTNRDLRTRVLLDLELIEADRVRSDFLLPSDDEDDGIRYDAAGNPVSYRVLREHPGSTTFTTLIGEADTVAAADMIHLFRKDRPGQRRGVSELAAGLQVFADLRRFAKATILAAEHAASYAGILYTEDTDPTDPANDDAFGDATPGEAVEVEHNSLLVVNNGRKLAQLKAEHPGTTYEMFHREKLREAARCLNMPYNVASGDSSDYNYASGRLDHQTYDRSIAIEQDYLGSACIDRVFVRWVAELRLDDLTDGSERNGGRRQPADSRVVKDWSSLPPVSEWDWRWRFDGRPHVDPLKEAAAAVTLRDACLQSEKAYFDERGLDQETEEAQVARELGISVPELRKLKALKRFAGPNGLSEAVLALLDEQAAEELAQQQGAADAA